MARISRKDIDGSYFHILVQGLTELSVFGEHRFKTYYIKSVLDKAVDFELYGYCVLDNHAHFVIHSESGIEEVSRAVRSINTAFALYYNRCKARSGYVFAGRFRCQVLADAEEAAAAVGFVHLNPMFDNPRLPVKQYPYSSAPLYESMAPFCLPLSRAVGIAPEELSAYIEKKVNATPLRKWMDVKSFVVKEDYKTVREQLREKYGLSEKLTENKDKLGRFASELSRRTGAPIVAIAADLGIGRETLRRAVSKAEKPSR